MEAHRMAQFFRSPSFVRALSQPRGVFEEHENFIFHAIRCSRKVSRENSLHFQFRSHSPPLLTSSYNSFESRPFCRQASKRLLWRLKDQLTAWLGETLSSLSKPLTSRWDSNNQTHTHSGWDKRKSHSSFSNFSTLDCWLEGRECDDVSLNFTHPLMTMIFEDSPSPFLFIPFNHH